MTKCPCTSHSLQVVRGSPCKLLTSLNPYINQSTISFLVQNQLMKKENYKTTMAHQMLCLSFLVTLLVAMQGIHAVEYVVTNTAWNTPGGVCFNNQIGSDYSKLASIVCCHKFHMEALPGKLWCGKKERDQIVLVHWWYRWSSICYHQWDPC